MSISLHRFVCSAGALLATAALAGCGDGPKMAAVSGTVLVNGQPVEGAQVLFMPDGERAAGSTDTNGRFQLSTYPATMGRYSAYIV